MNFTELSAVLSEMGLPSYRTKQIYSWIHQKCALDYDEMTNLPLSLRERLKEELPLKKCTIEGQIYTAQRDENIRISHIVLMGMGEPLDNFDNVMRFLELVTCENGLNISMRNISLSTCGIVPGIYKLLDKRLQLTLSISLHAPYDELRSKIMPINRRYSLDELMPACREYAKVTSRRISFEYAMLGGVNDSDECALKLAALLKGMLCHVNLIPVNEVAESPYKPSTPERIERFISILEKKSINVTVRRKLGSDIDASCGQLRLRKIKEQ